MTASLDGGGLVATPRPAPAPRAGGSTGRARGPLAGHFPAVPWAAFHVPLLPESFDAGKALILLKFNVPVSAFAAHAFGVTASKSSPNSVLWRFCLFSSMNF